MKVKAPAPGRPEPFCACGDPTLGLLFRKVRRSGCRGRGLLAVGNQEHRLGPRGREGADIPVDAVERRDQVGVGIEGYEKSRRR
jgi:hypothetical protein